MGRPGQPAELAAIYVCSPRANRATRPARCSPRSADAAGRDRFQPCRSVAHGAGTMRPARVLHPLDNIVWHSPDRPRTRSSRAAAARCAGTRAASRRSSASRTRAARFRGARGPSATPDEDFYCDGWSGDAPPGWHVAADSTMFKMVWEGAPPRTPTTTGCDRGRGREHAAQALALAGSRSPDRSAPARSSSAITSACSTASASSRWQASACRRARCARSAACARIRTFQGRGFARRLMRKLVRRQMLRGRHRSCMSCATTDRARAVRAHGVSHVPRIAGAARRSGGDFMAARTHARGSGRARRPHDDRIRHVMVRLLPRRASASSLRARKASARPAHTRRGRAQDVRWAARIAVKLWPTLVFLQDGKRGRAPRASRRGDAIAEALARIDA